MAQAVPSLVFDGLLVVQIVFLTTGTVLSVVAALGYRGTPWAASSVRCRASSRCSVSPQP